LADVDGDGRLDFIIAGQWGESYLFKNESPAGSFLALHLLSPVNGGPETFQERVGNPGPDLYGRPAIGATAAVHLPDGRTLSAEVDGGSGHSGKRSTDLHFGLGATKPDATLQVDLAWRDATGRVVRKTVSIHPGWHTIVLGQ
ncbi:MAG TPA: ASPIC/UnbV domain-containing protein, partial [Candidatus Angelobacter sp.]|nr:ASPIC/UnbV domain-containing protein [Candidatus Angelobacter sp.]